MLFAFLACSFRAMVGGSIDQLPSDVLSIRPDAVQMSTQHYFFVPAGPSFKGRFSENHTQLSTGLGVGLVSLLPQRSRWFMNPPTIGVQILEWHHIDQKSYLGTLSPFVQLTAPPICLGRKACLHSVSLFMEYEYSNIMAHDNQHSFSLGIYWSPSN